jgi:hypothetical protein
LFKLPYPNQKQWLNKLETTDILQIGKKSGIQHL